MTREREDLLVAAWGIIANAGRDRREGPVVAHHADGAPIRDTGWCTESEEWVEAAIRWRDQYHAHLDARAAAGPPTGSHGEYLTAYLRAAWQDGEPVPRWWREKFQREAVGGG